MADLSMNDVKKLMAFMKETAGIESFIIFYDTGENFTFAFSKPNTAIAAYSITAIAEMIGKETAHLSVELAGEIPDEGPMQFIPDSEN